MNETSEDCYRDGNETNPDECCVCLSNAIDESFVLASAKTESLEDRGEAVAEVIAEKCDGYDVEQAHGNTLESYDDHLVGVAAITKCCEIGVDTHCVVQDVEDHKREDCKT